MSERPVTFACHAVLPHAPAWVCEQIARVEDWGEFRGYGPLPGIDSAHYEQRTPHMKGSRIRVRSRDGSAHVEEVLEWSPGMRVVMRLYEFTPPLSALADQFVEEWDLAPDSVGTRVRRRFSMYPRNTFARPLLWLISLLLRRAIARHLEQMRTSPLDASTR
jgi:hypothetical protein